MTVNIESECMVVVVDGMWCCVVCYGCFGGVNVELDIFGGDVGGVV